MNKDKMYIIFIQFMKLTALFFVYHNFYSIYLHLDVLYIITSYNCVSHFAHFVKTFIILVIILKKIIKHRSIFDLTIKMK